MFPLLLLLASMGCSSPALTGDVGGTGASSTRTGPEGSSGATVSQPAPSTAPAATEKFGCRQGDECTSTCDSGCVNIGWAEKHRDTCVNIRAFDCSCVSNTCYTDGKAPRQ